MLLKEIIKSVKNTGGCSCYNNMIYNNNDGYIVSIEGGLIVRNNLFNIFRYYLIVKKYKNSKFIIGIWSDNNKLYIDKNIYRYNLQNAIETGRKNNQIAIFDLKNQKSLYIS